MRSELVTQFNIDGFAIVKDLFSAEQLDVISMELEHAVNTVPSLPPEKVLDNVYFEGNSSSVFLIGDLGEISTYWSELENFRPILKLVPYILQDEASSFEFVQALTKHPQTNRSVNWHRDFPNKAIPRADSRSVRMLLCLDPQTEKNGAIKIVRNSHLVSDEEARLQRPARVKTWKDEDEVTLSCKKGSLILLHSKMIHGGGPNFSAYPRRIVTFSWAHSKNQMIGESATT